MRNPTMRKAAFLVITAIAVCLEIFCLGSAAADQNAPASDASSAQPTGKVNAYVGCINRLSGRAFDARERYFSWVGKNGPTGKERIIYGTYTIYDTSDCKKNVAAANAMEPHDAGLAAAANGDVTAGTARAP